MGLFGAVTFMVLKKFLHISLFISLIGATALRADTDIKTKNVEMQIALDKNQNELVEDIFDSNEDALNKDREALEKLALSFERREKYMDASKTYKKLIGQFYPREHEAILARKAQENINPTFYSHTRLPYYYYKLAFLFVQQFRQSHDYTSNADRKKLYQLADTAIVFAEKVTSNKEETKALRELMIEKKKTDIDLKYKSSWFLSIGTRSWQDHVYLYNKSNSTKSSLLTTNIGACLGGGKKWENIQYELNVEGCYFQGKSTISSQNTNQYEQSSVPVSAVIIGPGIYFKSLSDYIKLGVQVPFFYRTGSWTLPEGNYAFGKKTLFGGGIEAQMKVKTKYIDMVTKIGKLFPNPSTAWSLGLSYDL